MRCAVESEKNPKDKEEGEEPEAIEQDDVKPPEKTISRERGFAIGSKSEIYSQGLPSSKGLLSKKPGVIPNSASNIDDAIKIIKAVATTGPTFAAKFESLYNISDDVWDTITQNAENGLGGENIKFLREVMKIMNPFTLSKTPLSREEFTRIANTYLIHDNSSSSFLFTSFEDSKKSSATPINSTYVTDNQAEVKKLITEQGYDEQKAKSFLDQAVTDLYDKLIIRHIDKWCHPTL